MRFLACASILAFSGLASAQTTLTVDVTPGGVYASGDLTIPIYQATCNGTQTTSSISGDPAQLTLSWTVPANSAATTLFADTENSCNTGLATTNPDSGLANSTINGTQIPVTPLPCTGVSTSCGVGSGYVTIDLRQILSTAFATFFPGTRFDGGDDAPCSPGEQPGPSLYLCIVETVNNSSTLSSSQTSSYWYMQIAYDTLNPPAPTTPAGQSGDENVNVSWSYSSTTLPADHYLVYYTQDPTPGMTADSNGNCSVAASGQSGRQYYPRLLTDGGCPISDEDDFGNCCGDAGVDGGGGCNLFADAGPVDVTEAVCDSCNTDADCTATLFSSCVLDSLGNSYCAEPCTPDAGTLSLQCPQGFLCQSTPNIDNSITRQVCVPPDGLCRPPWLECNFCKTAADCGPGNECVPSGDGGNLYCAVPCSDGGVNFDGTGSCLGDTVCESVNVGGGGSGTFCGPTNALCYDSTPLAIVLDGGDALVVHTDGGVDAGTGSGINPSGWAYATFPATATSGQITGLSNGVCYDFVVQAILSDGTQGYVSNEVVQAPVEDFDFWRLYQGAGGQDQGGLHCQAGGGAAGVLGVAIGLLALRRRRPTR